MASKSAPQQVHAAAADFVEVLKNGLLFRVSTKDDKHIKIWFMDDTIYYRILKHLKSQKNIKAKKPTEQSQLEFEQSDIVSVPLSDIVDVEAGKDAFSLTLNVAPPGVPIKMMAEVPGERDVLAKGFENLVQKERANAASVADAANAGPPPAEENPPTGLSGVLYDFVTMSIFDNFILFCIAVNCVTMAMTKPEVVKKLDGDHMWESDDSQTQTLGLISLALTIIFIVEMVLKMIAFGFFQEKVPGSKQPAPGNFKNGYPGYFQDNWNKLDFFIVVVGLLGFLPFFGNFTVLRTFRVFRPLRSLGKLQGMKSIINTLLISLDELFDVVVLTTFIFFIFSVLGMELFMGLGANRCLDVSNQEKDWDVMSDDVTFPIEARRCGGWYECPSGYQCYATGRFNHGNGDKQTKMNMNDGITGYDNLPQAFITVFVAVTLEGWVDIMYFYQDSYNWITSTVFHTLMVLLGAFFCLNLALAVIADTFEEEDAKADKEQADEEEKERQEALAKGEEPPDHDDEGLEEIIPDRPSPKDGDSAVGPWTKFRNLNWDVVTSVPFFWFITLMIVFNTAALASQYVRTKCVDYDPDKVSVGYNNTAMVGECIVQAAEMPQKTQTALVICNLICVVVFAIEMVMKIIAFGLGGYCQDSFNIFDGMIVLVSFVEFIPGVSGTGPLSALRAARLARIFKMARSWGSLRSIIESLIQTLPSIGSMCILLFLYMFIASVLGMQLMGNYIPHEERARWDAFPISMLTVFQMLTGENWNENMFSAMIYTESPAICLYFIAVVLIGIFIVLNLFLAILLSDFEIEDPPDFGWIFGGAAEGDGEAVTENGLEEDLDTESRSIEMSNMDDEGFSAAQLAKMEGNEHKEKEHSRRRSKSQKTQAALKEQGNIGAAEIVAVRNRQKSLDKEAALAAKRQIHGNSCGTFAPDNPIRIKVNDLVKSNAFEAVILLCIIAGSVILAVDGPTGDKSLPIYKIFKILDWIFLVVFTIEMGLKLFAFGVFSESKHTYFKDPWNILDAFIVFTGWITQIADGSGLEALKALRCFRSLRPLRTIQRAPGLKVVVMVLFQCTPTFVNICLVVFFFFLVFAIMGVQFFAGKFWACNDTSVDNVNDCTGYFMDDDGNYGEREWTNQKMNFDNVWTALLTLYEVSSLEMWLDVMYAAMDAPEEIGSQPAYEKNWIAAFFFVAFILIGVFLVLNLFVGAVIDKFNELKEANEGASPLLTDTQKEYTASVSTLIRIRPFRKPMKPGREGWPKWVHNLRVDCYKLTMWDVTGRGLGTSFDMVVSTLVFLNICIMSFSYWRRIPDDTIYRASGEDLREFQQTDYWEVIERLNDCFTFIFLIEMAIKLAAWGFKQYIMDMWNVLDGFLVIMSVLGFIMENILMHVFPLNPGLFRILRLARLTRALRAVRMVSRIKGISKLLDTLVLAIPAMANVAALLFLVIFIFTVLGMQFYGDVSIHKEHVNAMYNDYCNFRTFGTGFMLLFRSSTGESWNGVMHDIMLYHREAWIFFLVYMIFVSALLFELLTAIVLDEFGNLDDVEDGAVPTDFVTTFTDEWAHLDPEATKMIPLHKVSALFLTLKVDDMPVFKDKKEAVIALSKMDIATIGQAPEYKVHYVDTLVALMKYLFVKKYKGENPDVETQLETTFVEASQVTVNIVQAYPDLKKNLDTSKNTEVSDFKEHFAANKLQSAAKARKARRSVSEKRTVMEQQLEELRQSTGVKSDGTKALTNLQLQEEMAALRASVGNVAEL